MQAKIRTYTGRLVDVLAMRPCDIDITDIAHALSQVNRFGGHTRFPYSVGQHCWKGSYEFTEPRLALGFLLHDASEAYLGDITRPLKNTVWGDHYKVYERGVEAAIANHFGIRPDTVESACIHDVDMRMCDTEQRDLMPHSDMEGKQPFAWRTDNMTAGFVKHCFLDRYQELRRVLA